MAGKTTSKTQQNHYAAYKATNKFATNRKRKLLKLQKEQPNNEQIAVALGNISYRRATPKASMWSHTSKEYAQVLKSFKKPSLYVAPKISDKKMFSLAERAHDGLGNLVWNS